MSFAAPIYTVVTSLSDNLGIYLPIQYLQSLGVHQSFALEEEQLQAFCITSFKGHDGAGMQDMAIASPDCDIPELGGEDFQPFNHPGCPGLRPHPETPIFPKKGEVGE